MRRLPLILWSLFAVVVIPIAAGCHEPKIKTYEERETQRESQPQMVSPGEPIVE